MFLSYLIIVYSFTKEFLITMRFILDWICLINLFISPFHKQIHFSHQHIIFSLSIPGVWDWGPGQLKGNGHLHQGLKPESASSFLSWIIQESLGICLNFCGQTFAQDLKFSLNKQTERQSDLHRRPEWVQWHIVVQTRNAAWAQLQIS